MDSVLPFLNWQATSQYLLKMLERLVVKGLILMIALIANNILDNFMIPQHQDITFFTLLQPYWSNLSLQWGSLSFAT
jgi:hypothetical protein